MARNGLSGLKRLLVAGSLFLAGCGETIVSPEAYHDDAVVVSKRHTSSSKITIGKMSVTIPETNNIKFKGEREFEVNNKRVYDRFNMGDRADVSYTQVKDNEDGNLKYKFFDAVPIKK